MPRTQKIAVLCLLACGLMVGASFLPWFSGPGGTFSGWDLYQHQRHSGANPFFITSLFTADDGANVPFFTGLVTIIGGLLLAASALLITAFPNSNRVMLWLVAALAILGVFCGIENIYFYIRFYQHGITDVSLRYGLIIVWVATFAGAFAMTRMLTRHRSATRPSPSGEPVGKRF